MPRSDGLGRVRPSIMITTPFIRDCIIDKDRTTESLGVRRALALRMRRSTSRYSTSTGGAL